MSRARQIQADSRPGPETTGHADAEPGPAPSGPGGVSPERLGAWLRAERQARGWDVPEMARQLVKATGGDRGELPAHESLVTYVRRWERAANRITERYMLLYCAALRISPDQFGPGRPAADAPAPAGHSARAAEREDPAPVPVSAMTAAPAVAAELSQICEKDFARTDHGMTAELATVARGDDLLGTVEQSALGHPAALRGAAGVVRVGAEQVDQLRAATDVFRRWDNEFGGGLRRRTVVGQLSEAAALLDGPFRDERTGRAFLVAVTDLAQLVGQASTRICPRPRSGTSCSGCGWPGTRATAGRSRGCCTACRG